MLAATRLGDGDVTRRAWAPFEHAKLLQLHHALRLEIGRILALELGVLRARDVAPVVRLSTFKAHDELGSVRLAADLAGHPLLACVGREDKVATAAWTSLKAVAMSFPEHFQTKVTADYVRYTLKDHSLKNPLLQQKKEKALGQGKR